MSDPTTKRGQFEKLSERERQVIGLAAAGLADKQIGQELEVSINTLRTYWNRIREKVGDSSRPALVAAYVADDLASNIANPLDPLAHDGWVMDVETRTLLASDAVNDQHGLERGKAHDAMEYARATHPEDVDTVRDNIFAVADGLKDSVHLVFRVVTPKGVELVNASIYGIKNASGRVAKVYGFRVQALDCRPESDSRFRIGHWEEEDYNCEHFTIDDEFAQILGVPTAGRVRRDDLDWHRHPDDSLRVRRECETAVAERRERLTTDVRLVLGDGEVVWGRAERRFDYRKDGTIHIKGTFSVFR